MKNYIIISILLFLILAPGPLFPGEETAGEGPPLASYIARFAQKYGERLGKHRTQSINKVPKLLDDSVTKNMTQAQVEAHYQSSNFSFKCPGYSFLYGVSSTYDEYNLDRSFQFSCAFMEDDKGVLLKKTKCNTDLTRTDNQSGQAGASTCANNEMVHGFDNKKFRDNKLQEDRQYKSMCCQLMDWENRNLKSLSTCQDFSYPAEANFDMECPQDMIVTKITSQYHSSSKDRAFSFTCCKVGT